MFLEILVKNEECKKYYFPDSFFNVNDDSGFDIYFPEEIVLQSMTTTLVDTGCVFILKNDKGERLPFYIYPRSSIYKTPMRLANSVGIIDKKYNGTIKIPVDNNSDSKFKIEKGTRYFQICGPDLCPVKCMTFITEKDLEETTRGTGGFGSTGNKKN
jgi:dUTP pyrophosphatase